MTDGTNNWNMVTYNHKEHTGTVPATLSVDVTVSTPSNAAMTMSTGSNPAWFDTGFEDIAGLMNFTFADLNLAYFKKNFIFDTSGTTLTHTGGNSTGAVSGSKTIVSTDKIKPDPTPVKNDSQKCWR